MHKQQVLTEFDQYKLLTTDAEREIFWRTVSERSEKLSSQQRVEYQRAVREQTDQILARMTTIAHQLTADKTVSTQ